MATNPIEALQIGTMSALSNRHGKLHFQTFTLYFELPQSGLKV